MRVIASRGPTAGEAWVTEQLDLLRAASFGPRAIADFLVNCQRRANRTRRSRPDLRAREVRWAAAGLGLWGGLAALDLQPFRRRLRAGLGSWGLTVVMLDWHLGMVETEDGRARNLGPADAATLLRAWLVPAVADDPSPLLCALGFATDILDGPLARVTETTRLGRDLEGLVDAAFLGAVLRGAQRRHLISPLVARAELARLGAGLSYAVACYLGRGLAPDRGLAGAARVSTPLRAAGVLVAGTGRQRLAGALLSGGSAIGTAAVARTYVSGRRRQ